MPFVYVCEYSLPQCCACVCALLCGVSQVMKYEKMKIADMQNCRTNRDDNTRAVATALTSNAIKLSRAPNTQTHKHNEASVLLVYIVVIFSDINSHRHRHWHFSEFLNESTSITVYVEKKKKTNSFFQIKFWWCEVNDSRDMIEEELLKL